MLSGSDILKLLEQIPVWKSLRTLPGRVEELENAVAQLEKQIESLQASPRKAEHLLNCELCGKPAKITNISDHPVFGDLGKKVREVTCEDGHKIDYDWKPGKG